MLNPFVMYGAILAQRVKLLDQESKMANETNSSELVQWLRLLSLPWWVKCLLVVLLFALFAVGVGLIYFSVTQQKLEFAAAGATLLTVLLPVSLIIVALIFGISGNKALNKETKKILIQELPEAIKSLLANEQNANNAMLSVKVRGCIGYYKLNVENYEQQELSKTLRFHVELNVKKANLVIWLPKEVSATSSSEQLFKQFTLNHESTLNGAMLEGYSLNEHPSIAVYKKAQYVGCVFIVKLDPDFLMKAPLRLYWANDCAFFIKGLLSSSDFNVTAHS
jgi:hypothetical protein